MLKLNFAIANGSLALDNLRPTPQLPAVDSLLLTSRQRQVLLLICDGASTKEIAFQLRISEKTVEYHKSKLYRIAGVTSIATLVRKAIRVGLLQP
jgi:DNA-binding NarL/FixJ family response regulator